MAKKFYAVDGMTVDFIDSNDSGDLTITGSPSTKDLAVNKGIYKNATAITVSNFENNNVINGTGSGAFIASSTKNLTESLNSLRADDIAVISGTGTNKNPPPATISFSTTVKITDANQDKVRGE